MDIDISIRNATQDELRQMFKGFLTPVRMGTAANFQSERWSQEEKDAIAGCADSDEAWESYHEKFPDSPRTQDAVRRMHQNIKVPAPLEEPAPIIKKVPGMAKKESALKNAQAPRWTDPEKEIIKRHVGDKDSAAAWKEYSEKFPGQRNEHSIYLKWYAYRIQGKKDKPVPPTEPVKRKIDARKLNRPVRPLVTKWQIPFSSKKVNGKVPLDYQRAITLCNKYGKPYPEALKLHEAAETAPVKSKRQTGKQVPCPYCKEEHNSHGIHMHVRGAHPDRYAEWSKVPDRLHHGIHQKTVPETVKETKEISATPAPEVTIESPQSDPGPAPTHHLTRGDKVRHNTAYPLFPGIGTVVKTSINGKEVMVDFGNGTEWLDRKNLELVPAGAKAA